MPLGQRLVVVCVHDLIAIVLVVFEIFCVQTLIQVKETSKVTLARGFCGLLVLWDGMEFFVFSVTTGQRVVSSPL